jgi:hypothetical protein
LSRTPGCAEAWVLTDRANPAAQRLYTAAGATDPPADAVMFTFRLAGGAGAKRLVQERPMQQRE